MKWVAIMLAAACLSASALGQPEPAAGGDGTDLPAPSGEAASVAVDTPPAATQPVAESSTQPASDAASPTTMPAATQPEPAVKSTPGDAGFARYEVLTSRSIFVRQRGQNDNRNGSQASSPAPAAPAWMLAGTALLSNERVAFIENARTGETSRVKEGETTGAGRVVKVHQDGVDMESDGRTVRIVIGGAIGNGEVTASGVSATTGPAPVAASPGGEAASVPPMSSDEAAILERLKARRAREMGGR